MSRRDAGTLWRQEVLKRTWHDDSGYICYVMYTCPSAHPQQCIHESVGVMGFHKSTLVARGANTQLATNVDLFACLLLNACLKINHPQLAIDRAGA